MYITKNQCATCFPFFGEFVEGKTLIRYNEVADFAKRGITKKHAIRQGTLQLLFFKKS